MFDTESKKFLIAGLGNIGEEYANTRHNVGFLVLDALAKKLNTSFDNQKYAYLAETTYKGKNITLLKPATYMNLSGKALKYWINKKKIPLQKVLVVLDDINLPLGTLRMKPQGSDGGHNGLADVILNLETNSIPRLRIGIGNEFAKGYQVDYVLGKWTKEEEKVMADVIPVTLDAVLMFVCEGIVKAMNKYNNQKKL